MEDKKKARKMLEDRFEDLEAEDCRLDPIDPFRKLHRVKELLYCYEHCVLASDFPPSEINKMQKRREKRLRELTALLDSIIEAHEQRNAQFYAMRDEMRRWREERNNGNQIT